MHVLDKDMQAKISSPGLKISRSKELTVKAIFLDNHNWDTYYYINQDRIRDVELEEVQRMLGCKDGLSTTVETEEFSTVVDNETSSLQLFCHPPVSIAGKLDGDLLHLVFELHLRWVFCT